LKVFIIDFNTTKNLNRFLVTVAKILIANEYLGKKHFSLVNFSGTYDKSRRTHIALNELFDLVEEKKRENNHERFVRLLSKIKDIIF
jgi:hypothetical protein